ncbi:MAG: saccharopine dehydrogenase NADP-binding domain-containing protein [Flavobacteriales bacterium]|nr:saccharopine dehydrogenase NADP-binding domain-containing protein [Flavobacteriales bacterium]
MHNILVMGAGRSAISLIDYLIENAERESWRITVADANREAAESLVSGRGDVKIVEVDATSKDARRTEIESADLVISMLPAFLHIEVAKDCLDLKKNLITPSYISEEMKEMAAQVESAELTFMNELGVDPGIDHMSAMRLLNQTRDAGNEITCFESFTGGLVAPESDNNPWNYKFTWNPRNVVLAGQGGAVKFKHNGRFKYIPYQRLFRRTEIIEIPEYGRFEGYANRDSLKYRELYDLMEVPTIYRGTLRRTGFCRAWNVFVQMGMTDDSYLMEGSENMTHREFTNSFLAFNPDDSVELKLMHYMKLDQDSEITDKLKWLGIFDNTPIGLNKPSTPAQILQKILEKKWTLSDGDKDMIVMWHKLKYRASAESEEKEIHSSMVVIGDAQPRTAMAKTVGLPVGIAAKLLLNGTITRKGVYAPMYKDIYEPVLNELENYDIKFDEREINAKEKTIA